MTKWLSVKMVKPPCPRSKDALGTPVLIWPRNPCGLFSGVDGFCYYGKRATGRPEFYLYGAVIHGITHFQLMPKGPKP